jgi:ectoine utilization protein EutD
MPTLPFEKSEYLERLNKTKKAMQKRGFDLLLVADPANMCYLTGYNAWSFYTPQIVAVAPDRDEPIIIVRGMDVNGARETTWLKPENMIGFPDHYVQSTERHPMDYAAAQLKDRGLGKGRVGTENDAFFYAVQSHEALKRNLPDARFEDASLLVNWVRAVKSPKEIEYIAQAGKIMDRVMEVAIGMIRPGVRQCDAVAEIYRAQIAGTKEFGGDYTAFVPMLPTGRGTSTPHLTWTDEPYRTGEATILELGAARHRYHCPQARTVFLGKPPQKIADTAKIVVEGIAAALDAAKPGATGHEVEAAWRAVISRHGITKDSRIGYSVGLNYVPDWGEHTISLRPNDPSVLEPNMVLHVIPGIWADDWGIEISECIRITDKGAQPFCTTERKLFVKE